MKYSETPQTVVPVGNKAKRLSLVNTFQKQFIKL